MRIFLFISYALVSFSLQAQNLIAVEHNGVSKFYSTLDSAVNAAQTGDNVYVPGGNFILNLAINKGFNLIGVGNNPDSTVATGVTQITANNNVIHVVSGADNGSLTGIFFFNSGIQFGTSSSDQKINSYHISRCRISSLQLGAGSGSAASTNLVFTENIIESTINGLNIQNCSFSKNVFNFIIYNFEQGNQFENNLFLFNGNLSLINTTANSIFKNNIFLFNQSPSIFSNSSSANSFYNNLFVSNLNGGYLPGSDVNSIYGVTQSSIFVNQTGNSYDYHQDYHLKTTCPGKNYGTDGTDVGVYGTATPWKEGGVPYNPHVQFQSIASQTNASGNLSVNIRVSAQKN